MFIKKAFFLSRLPLFHERPALFGYAGGEGDNDCVTCSHFPQAGMEGKGGRGCRQGKPTPPATVVQLSCNSGTFRESDGFSAFSFPSFFRPSSYVTSHSAISPPPPLRSVALMCLISAAVISYLFFRHVVVVKGV